MGGPWAFIVDSYRGYAISSPDNVMIINTGNVQVIVKIYLHLSATLVSTHTPDPGNYFQFSIPVDPAGPIKEVMVVLEGANTISDRSKFEPADNGQVYFTLSGQ